MIRPLQIIHEPSCLASTGRQMMEGLNALKDQGIGGIVTNVSFERYFEDERKWQELTELLQACKSLGMRVWLYDEKGYPSGSAGGRVLKSDPSLEAQGLFRDGERFFEDRAYEGTHASNNYHERRRYINLLNPKATQRFIELTHEEYRRRLVDVVWPVEAFFTDEPSLIPLNLGTLPTDVEKRVPVLDPPDIGRERLPMIAWSKELSQSFDLKQAAGFFSADENDKSLKGDYYRKVGELVANSYFGQIRNWCRRHGMLTVGHLLWEEKILAHPALYGNPLRCLMQMDIPGIDVLDSVPESGFNQNLSGAILIASAAMLNGTRRLMTETSDFGQVMSQGRLATLNECKATAAWQAALGFTDFAWYYSWGGNEKIPHPVDTSTMPILSRTSEEYREFNNFVHDLVTHLAPASLKPDVFLYYPIELVQESYVPTATPYHSMELSPRLVQIRDAFNQAISQLVHSGIFPCLVDGEMLSSAIWADDEVRILNARAKAIVYPEGCFPPESVTIHSDIPVYEMNINLPKRLYLDEKIRLYNMSESVLVTIMSSDGQNVVTCVNMKDQPRNYEFHVAGKVYTGTLRNYETKLIRF